MFTHICQLVILEAISDWCALSKHTAQRLSTVTLITTRYTINLPCEEGERGKLHHHWPQQLWQRTWGWLRRRSCPMWPLTPGYHRSIGHSSPAGQRRDGICSAVQLVSYLCKEQRGRINIGWLANEFNDREKFKETVTRTQERELQYEPTHIEH